MTHDPHRIIPLGVMAAEIRPVALQVRMIVEYDTRYMQDRVRADLFANGHPLGLYAVATDTECRHPSDLIPRYGRDLERMVLGELSKGITTASRVADLEAVVVLLNGQIEALRRPWWRRTYDKVGSWISGVR